MCLLLCRVGAPGDIVATSRQLDSARRRRRARRRALGDRYARGARGGRRHRQAGQVSRGIRGEQTCKHGNVSCTTPSVNQEPDDCIYMHRIIAVTVISNKIAILYYCDTLLKHYGNHMKGQFPSSSVVLSKVTVPDLSKHIQ